MISDQWFYMGRFFKNWPKIVQFYQNSMKNKGNTPILTNIVGVYPRNIHTKCEANPCSGLREEVEKVEEFTTTRTKTMRDTG